MPAARDQAQERRLERVGLEEVRGDVALQMVRRPRAACAWPPRATSRWRPRPAARRSGPGPRVTASDSIVRELDPGLGQRRVDDRVDELEVMPRRDLRARRRRTARERRPARRSRWSGSSPPSVTAAQVSSQEVSIARIKPSTAAVPDLEPHDQGVLAVVVVVATAVAGAAEAELLVHRDRPVVRGAHLERVARLGAGLVEQPLEQPARDPLAPPFRCSTAMFIRCQTSA